MKKDNPFHNWVASGHKILDWPMPTGKKLRDSTLDEVWELGRLLMKLAQKGLQKSSEAAS